jgi:hypothetical protein
MAGPLVTLILMGLFLAGYFLGFDVWLSECTGKAWPGELFRWGLYANAFMGLLNLVPMMPLDGGNTFRAFLAFKMDPRRATEIAATIGQVLSVVLACVGIDLWVTDRGFWPFLLVGLGVWGWLTCHQERRMAREGLVYVEGDRGWGDDGEAWKGEVSGPAKPGWLARLRERRRQARRQRETEEEQVFRERVDELLAKVKREGMESLTRSERRVLDEASARFRRDQNDQGGD